MRAKAYAVYGLLPSSSTAAAGHASRWSTSALIDMLLTWRERTRQRRALLTLEDYVLDDIGVSRADVELEANKPFWHC